MSPNGVGTGDLDSDLVIGQDGRQDGISYRHLDGTESALQPIQHLSEGDAYLAVSIMKAKVVVSSLVLLDCRHVCMVISDVEQMVSGFV